MPELDSLVQYIAWHGQPIGEFLGRTPTTFTETRVPTPEPINAYGQNNALKRVDGWMLVIGTALFFAYFVGRKYFRKR